MTAKVHFPTPCLNRLHRFTSQYEADSIELARRERSHNISEALEAEETLRWHLGELDYTMPNFLVEALAYLRAELKSMEGE